jgi:hypothetical protein
MDLYGNPLADLVFVNARSERRNCPHVFMAWRKILIVGQAALDHGGRTVVNDFKVGRADRNGVNSNKNLSLFGNRHGFGS